MKLKAIKKNKSATKFKLSNLKKSATRVILFVAILIIFTALFKLIVQKLNLSFSFAFIGLTYTIFIMIIDKYLVTRGNEIWIVPLVYSLMTVYFALLISEVLIKFSVNIGEVAPHTALTDLDYTYFTLITMLSVGYGDLSPVTPCAQKVSMIIAMFGSAHMLVSVALFFNKINNPKDLNQKTYNQNIDLFKVTLNQQYNQPEEVKTVKENRPN